MTIATINTIANIDPALTMGQALSYNNITILEERYSYYSYHPDLQVIEAWGICTRLHNECHCNCEKNDFGIEEQRNE